MEEWLPRPGWLLSQVALLLSFDRHPTAGWKTKKPELIPRSSLEPRKQPGGWPEHLHTQIQSVQASPGVRLA